MDDVSGERRIVGRDILTRDGHYSFTRDGTWLLTDTGPDEGNRQTLMLWNMAEENQVILGRFASPLPFRGEIRCDLHPPGAATSGESVSTRSMRARDRYT